MVRQGGIGARHKRRAETRPAATRSWVARPAGARGCNCFRPSRRAAPRYPQACVRPSTNMFTVSFFSSFEAQLRKHSRAWGGRLRLKPKFIETYIRSAESGQNWPKLAQAWPRAAQMRPISAQFWSDSTQTCSKSARAWPASAQILPKSAPTLAEAGRHMVNSVPYMVDICPHVAQTSRKWVRIVPTRKAKGRVFSPHMFHQASGRILAQNGTVQRTCCCVLLLRRHCRRADGQAEAINNGHVGAA